MNLFVLRQSALFTLALLGLVTVGGLADVRAAELEYLGKVTVGGQESDLSGLSGRLPDGTPLNQLGGWSAIERVQGNQYLILPDRGPLDGAVPYPCRVQLAEVEVTPGKSPVVQFRLLATIMLKDQQGVNYVGEAAALSGSPQRLDPEAIRVVRRDPLEFLISDEYGPLVIRFDAQGREIGRLDVPARLQPRLTASGAADPLWGRADNAGMEGLAVTPDQQSAWGMMQRPLLQDHAYQGEERVGRNCRFVQFPLTGTGGPGAEFVYQLDSPGNGISEVLAVNDRQFLVLERDGKAGKKSTVKRLYLSDLTGATDVSRVERLPADQLPSSIQPVSKQLFLDLLAPAHRIPVESIAEKFEGLTFGPPLPDGRALLLISVDNDFRQDQVSEIYAFAVRW